MTYGNNEWFHKFLMLKAGEQYPGVRVVEYKREKGLFVLPIKFDQERKLTVYNV